MTAPNTVQRAYRGRATDSVGLNVDSGWAAAENGMWTQDCAVPFRIRIEVDETNNRQATVGWVLQYSYNAEAWVDVTPSATHVRPALSSQFTDGDATTNLLTSSSQTFIAGEGVTDADGADQGLRVQQSEYEFCVQFVRPNVVHGVTTQFRIAGLDSYVNTPQCTISKTPITVEEAETEAIDLAVTAESGGSIYGVTLSNNINKGVIARGGFVYEETLYDFA